MGHIRIDSIPLSPVPAASKQVTVKYRLTSAPDVDGSYTLATTLTIQPDGSFIGSPYYIEGLLDETSYTVRAKTTCGGGQFDRIFVTGILCPDITAINGEAFAGDPEEA